MIRTVIASTVLVAGLLTPSAVAGGPAGSAAQSAAPVTAADATPFVGEWTLDLQGPNGPGAFDLIVKVEKDGEKEKVVGDITAETMATQRIESVSKADQSLVLSYTFNYEGNPVDAVVRLTPAPEGKMAAEITFAGGAYVMSGTATKKEKGK
jgi:hypothetical protein